MQPLVKTEGLWKLYSGFELGPIDLEIPGGCIVGLIGENGAGKTTLIRSILGIIRPSQGTVHLLPDTPDGVDPREDLGVVLDVPSLPGDRTLRQIGRIMGAAYKTWDSELYAMYLKRYGLSGGQLFGTLSKGTQVKLTMAVALSHSPRLLVLDEPAAGLDPAARDELMDTLFDFTRQEDHSVLISSHILSDLERVCDYIAFLHKGKLLFCQEKDRLLERYGICRCAPGQWRELPRAAVLGVRASAYGDEALVDRIHCPGAALDYASMEDIMVLTLKGVPK